jgi:uncharacterized protein
VARRRLVPRKHEFFDLYNRAAANAVAMSRRLVELLDAFPAGADVGMRDIKELEHVGDRITSDLVDLIHRSSRTPFDRDDMYRLAAALDDVCDSIDDTVEKVVGYGVRAVHERALRQAELVSRCTAMLAEAIAELDGFGDSRPQLRQLRALEHEGDKLVREAVSALFAGDPDAVSLVRWKDIYEQLEEAIDACVSAGDLLEAILVKNR